MVEGAFLRITEWSVGVTGVISFGKVDVLYRWAIFAAKGCLSGSSSTMSTYSSRKKWRSEPEAYMPHGIDEGVD